jgi:hypothetical protein
MMMEKIEIKTLVYMRGKSTSYTTAIEVENLSDFKKQIDIYRQLKDESKPLPFINEEGAMVIESQFVESIAFQPTKTQMQELEDRNQNSSEKKPLFNVGDRVVVKGMGIRKDATIVRVYQLKVAGKFIDYQYVASLDLFEENSCLVTLGESLLEKAESNGK